MGSRTTELAKIVVPPRHGRTAFLASCAVLVFLVAPLMLLCAGVELLAAFVMKPDVATVAAFTATTFALPYLFVILWLDRNEQEPLPLIVSALAWGAIVATGLSGIANTLFGAVSGAVTGDALVAGQLTASISAPLVEEITKGCALVAFYLFFRQHFDNVLDGVIYGALVGLGFAAFENFTYYVSADNIGGVLFLTLLRGVITSAGTHMCFTAMTGAGLGLFRVLRGGVLRWLLPPLGLMLAMFIHFSWNTFAQFFVWEGATLLEAVVISYPLAVAFLQVPFVVLALSIASLSLWHERKIIERFLAGEQESVVFPGEVSRLVPARRRALHTLRLLVTLRLGEWWITRRRNVRLVRLAFEKWHMDRELAADSPIEGREHAVRVRALRRELEALKLPDPS